MQKNFIPFLSLLVMFVSNSQGQTLKEFLLYDIQFDSVELINKSIRSVHIFSERIKTYRKSEETKVHTAKKMELEFNEVAQKSYQRNQPFKWNDIQLGGGKTAFQSFEFDDKNRVVEEKLSEGDFTRSFKKEYNSEGQIIKKIDQYGDYHTNTTEFIWENNTVIDVKFSELSMGNTEIFPQIKFNQKGEFTEYKSENSFFQIKRIDEKEYKITIWKHFKNDTLESERYTKIQKSNGSPVLHYALNADKDTTLVMHAEFDEIGNLIYLRNRKWINSYDADDFVIERHNDKTYIEESVYHINNFYSDGLISKRTISGAKNLIKGEQSKKDDTINRTERFHYDTETLPVKYWPELKKRFESEKETTKENVILEPVQEVMEIEETPPAPELPAKIDE